MANFTGANFGDNIIDELPNIFWANAFETSKTDLTGNLPPANDAQRIYDNISFMARTVLLPLSKQYPQYVFDGKWINSWYRNEFVNSKTEGASETSDHLSGLAIDIKIPRAVPQRKENADIFYFFWDYFKKNNLKFNQILWEVGKELRDNQDKFKFPQWVHVAFSDTQNKSGAQEVKAIGVNKTFESVRINDGYSNEGTTNFSELSKTELFNYFLSKLQTTIPIFIDKNFSFDDLAKFTLLIGTLLDINGTQLDFITSKNRFDYFEGGLLRWKGKSLYDVLKNGNTTVANEYLNNLNQNETLINSKRNDKDYLETLSNTLRVQTCVDGQIKLIGDKLYEVFVRGKILNLREPLCYIFMLECYIADSSNLDVFQAKLDTLGMTTDGSWLDYYANIDSKLTNANKIKEKYGLLINNYFKTQ